MAVDYKSIYKVIRRIPRGRVATYGQIATLAGIDGHARQVGYALHSLPSGADVPWHRVINSRGEVSPRSASDSHELQRMLLESEGVEFDKRGRVELKRFLWAIIAARSEFVPRAPSRQTYRRRASGRSRRLGPTRRG